MGDWFNGGRRLPEAPCKTIMTRGELQRMLKARIEQGDQEAAWQWERWKQVDRLFDAFRDKPLYPQKDNNNRQSDK